MVHAHIHTLTGEPCLGNPVCPETVDDSGVRMSGR